MGDGFLEVRRARDISEGGVGIYVPHHFEGCDIQGTVTVVVKIGNDKPFMAKGLIKHKSTDGSYFGIQFTELSDDARAKINEYVERRIAEGGLV